MLLSFLSDRPGRSLAMRTGDFMASARHVKAIHHRILRDGHAHCGCAEPLRLGVGNRSLANFDVLSTALAELYPSSGVRPDLLFAFNEGEDQ
jgi:hypothetical protein